MTAMFPDYTSERINYGMIKTFLDIIVLAMLNGELMRVRAYNDINYPISVIYI
jgi:hypothetical protein